MKKYSITLYASYIGYVVQALVINFAPLLFVTFSNNYNLSLGDISTLIVVNFLAQLTMDLMSAILLDKFGYRVSAVLAHAFSSVGIALLAFLPDITKNPMTGLLICMILGGIGGGIIEVIISPIVEALPTKSKSASMSLLHSFYSWGQLLIILLSTLFFYTVGITEWRMLAVLWAIIPFINGIIFIFVPIIPLIKEGEKGLSIKELFSIKVFWIFLIAMLAGGASEQAIIQWTSAYAEKSLGLKKAVGDLLGPCMFALLMGISRVFYTLFHEKVKLLRYMIISAAVLIASCLVAALIPNPYISLMGCALSGMAVGIMWPGMLSLTSRYIKNGGTAQFSLLAFFGDLGCISGPGIVGWVSEAAEGGIRTGFLWATIFPLIMLITLLFIKKLKKGK